MKNPVLKPSEYQFVTGKKKYVLDVPNGDLDFDCHVFSDHDVLLVVLTPEGGIPYASGQRFRAKGKVEDATEIHLYTEPKASVVVRCTAALFNSEFRKEHAVVEIEPLRPQEVDIQSLVGKAIAAQLADTRIDMSEEHDFEDDEQDPFDVAGYMEADEPVEAPPVAQAPPAKPKSPESPSDDSEPSVAPSEGTDK